MPLVAISGRQDETSERCANQLIQVVAVVAPGDLCVCGGGATINNQQVVAPGYLQSSYAST